MSMSTGKENVPTTPGDSGKILKPISPNKGQGKLNFLQNDNIEDHFNHIHSVNNLIQQQLHNIETQSKQTGADVGQLYDRSKNNNQNLNKLLENIANYSEEVVTKGNATKQDIYGILERLEGIKVQNEKQMESSVEESDLLKKLSDILTKKQLSKGEDDAKLEDISKRLSTLQENLTSNDNIKQDLEVINKQLQSVSGFNSKLDEISKLLEVSTLSEVSVKQIIDPIKKEFGSVSKVDTKLDELSKKLNDLHDNAAPRDTVQQILNPIVKELQSVLLDAHTQGLLENILHKDKSTSIELKLATLTKKLEECVSTEKLIANNTAKLDSKLTILTTKDIEGDAKMINMEAILISIENGLKAEKMGANIDELEKKYANLEEKYKKLSGLYEEKYDSYVQLQEKFKDLSHQVETMDTTTGNKLTKVRQLHTKKMSEFTGSAAVRTSKRVASVPVRKIDSVIEESNNSDYEN